LAKITTFFVEKAECRPTLRHGCSTWSQRAIGWAGDRALGGVLVQRQPGEPFEDSVIRAFDGVDALL
jgi:hypothetical protein